MNLNTKKDGTTIKMKKRGHEVVVGQAPAVMQAPAPAVQVETTAAAAAGKSSEAGREGSC